ncbi:hypothetical protein BFP72_12695 [Reichenbachiella sp. 5M10]|nr:hypothetical protein BFP72_12695 [Reichenbachiella sp. 5M10]
MNTINSPIALINNDYKLEFANPSFCEFTNCTAESLIGKPISEVNPNLWSHAIGNKFEACLKGHPVDPEPYSVSQGSFSLNFTPHIDEKNEICAVFITVNLSESIDKAKNTDFYQEESFIQQINALPDSFLILQDGRIKLVNDMLCQISGYSKKELLNQDFTKFTAPEVFEKLQSFHKNRAQGLDAPLRYESIALSKSGKRIPVETTIVPTIFQMKPAWQVVLRDITDYKTTLNQLRESEEKYRFIAETTLDGIFIHDNGVVIECNQAMLNITGYTKEEIIGVNLLDVVLSKNESKSIQAQLTKKHAKPYIVNVKKKDGSLFKAEVEGQMTQYKGKKVRLASFKDVTERFKAEQDLQKFKTIADKSLYGNVIANLDGSMIYVNEYFAKKHGYSRDELIGKKLTIFHTSEQNKILIEAIPDLIKNGHIENIETTNVHKNGMEFPMQMSVTCINDENEHPAFIGVSAFDLSDRKKSEAAIRLSEEKFRELYDQSPVAIQYYGKDGELLDVNKKTLQLFGIKSQDAIAPFNMWDSEHFTEKNKQELKSGKTITISSTLDFDVIKKHNYFKTSKKGLHYIELQIAPLLIQHKAMSYLVYMTDVTERKNAEENFAKEKELLNAIIDNIPVLLTRYDPSSNVQFLNKEFEKKVGWKTAELQTIDLLNKVYPDPDYREKALAYMQKATSEWKEFRITSKFGHHIDSEWCNIKLDGGVQIGIGIDITDRKKAENQLRHHQELLNEMGRIAMVGAWEFDPATGKGFWTDEVARIHDLDPTETTSMELGLTFYKPESRVKIEMAIQAAIDSGTPYDLKLELISKKGIHKWVRTIGHPTKQNGKVVKIQGSFQDITEMKKAEEELQKNRNKLAEINENLENRVKERTAKLEQKNKELEQFSYIASHDLQEPLRTISNYIQVVHEDFEDTLSEEVLVYLQAISKSTERMRALIFALMNFSRLGHNRSLTEVNSEKIVTEVIEDLQQLIQSKKAKIEVGRLPRIYAYETELRQVFQNLISNALKFQKANHTCDIQINYLELENHHQFSVSDNGIGIASKDIDRIFHIFQKLHLSQTYEGHGIGLAYCKKIIELHDGDIWAESEKGKGSTFYFTLSKSQSYNSTIKLAPIDHH